MTEQTILPNLLIDTKKALSAAEDICDVAKEKLRALVCDQGHVSNDLMERYQTEAHGFAWIATYVESLRQMQNWAKKLESDGKFLQVENLFHQIAFG